VHLGFVKLTNVNNGSDIANAYIDYTMNTQSQTQTVMSETYNFTVPISNSVKSGTAIRWELDFSDGETFDGNLTVQ
jgi:hypothetical protein